MKNNFVILLISLSLYSCKSDSLSPENPNYADKFAKIQNHLDSSWSDYAKKNKIPDSCGIGCYISIKGVNHFFKTISKNTINENYHFRIASNTKMFTAAAIMLLHQNGKLNINDIISQKMPNSSETYLPDITDFNIPYKNRITIKQLMQHRSGVYDLANDPIPNNIQQPYHGQFYSDYQMLKFGIDYQFSIDELIKVVSDCKIYYDEPGVAFHYSNTGYQVLAKIIERVSGKNYTDFINTEIIQKNGLSQTSAPWISTDYLLPEPYANGYVIIPSGCYNVTKYNMSFNIAEGNIIASFSDMNKWIKLLLTGEAGISKENISLMKDYSDNPVDMFGLGIEYRDGIGFGHTGSQKGYSSKVFYNPELDLSATFLCNFWNYSDGANTYREQQNFTQDLLKSFINILKY